MTQARPTERSAHAELLNIVHQEAGRTLSRADFELCMRVAERATALHPIEGVIAKTIPAAVETLRAALLNRDTVALGGVLALVNLIRSRNLAGVASHINEGTDMARRGSQDPARGKVDMPARVDRPEDLKIGAPSTSAQPR